ncbi:cortex morphogenetic protein CmpA [Peribacillus frigoritolerans]|nr:cortex morphogenetic protein CmpA [Peribacillus frigoritolerans]
MPNWFQNQIRKAFYEKDYYQVKMLNQCWFFLSKERKSQVIDSTLFQI